MLKRIITLLMSLLVLGVHSPEPTVMPEDAQLHSFYYHYYGMMMPLISGIDAELTQDGWIATFLLGPQGDVEDIRLTEQDVQLLTGLIEEYDLHSWNGFDESDPMALDGEGFSFSASYEGGVRIEAKGSNSFPEGYFDAQEAILSAIEKMLIAHNIPYLMDE